MKAQLGFLLILLFQIQTGYADQFDFGVCRFQLVGSNYFIGQIYMDATEQWAEPWKLNEVHPFSHYNLFKDKEDYGDSRYGAKFVASEKENSRSPVVFYKRAKYNTFCFKFKTMDSVPSDPAVQRNCETGEFEVKGDGNGCYEFFMGDGASRFEVQGADIMLDFLAVSQLIPFELKDPKEPPPPPKTAKEIEEEENAKMGPMTEEEMKLMEDLQESISKIPSFGPPKKDTMMKRDSTSK